MAKDKDEKKEEAVLSFLIAQNRPFSLNDLLRLLFRNHWINLLW